MIPTLQTFIRALLTPDLSLATLTDAQPLKGADSLPRLARTTRFAEAEIEWQGKRWLLSLPLTASALPRIERAASAIRRLNSEWIAPYRILPGELRWCDATGEARTTDLILQYLPEGRTFAEALLTEEKSTLLTALTALETELHRLKFTHNNLKSANLRWSHGRLIPLRYQDAGIGDDTQSDTAAFEALRREITETPAPQQTLSDTTAAYTPLRPLTGHEWVSNVFEGLICIQDKGRFGYVDADNNPVISAQYSWADDFHEGRAEVATPEGMGLIDREGRYIIPPEYEVVEYDPANSIVRVRQNGLWALFDYLGHRLTPFQAQHDAVGSDNC